MEKSSIQIYRLFANIGKIISSGKSYEETTNFIMVEIELFFSPKNWSLMRVDEATGELFFARVKGDDLEKYSSIRLKPGEGIAGKVVHDKKSVFVSDTSGDSQFSRRVDLITGFQTKSIIAVPLIFKDKVYGVIEIINRQDGCYFSEEDHLIMKTIADFAAIGLYNAQVFDKLSTIAYFDPLTHLFNRSRLNIEFLNRKTLRSHKERRHYHDNVITVVMIDMDRFKLINDEKGHRCGDSVLVTLADQLQNLTREQDMVFRVGGDEFLIVLSSPHENDAQLALSRIIKELDQLNEKNQKAEIPFQFSYGYSQGSRFDLEELMDQADKEMYKNKEKKRSL